MNTKWLERKFALLTLIGALYLLLLNGCASPTDIHGNKLWAGSAAPLDEQGRRITVRELVPPGTPRGCVEFYTDQNGCFIDVWSAEDSYFAGGLVGESLNTTLIYRCYVKPGTHRFKMGAIARHTSFDVQVYDQMVTPVRMNTQNGTPYGREGVTVSAIPETPVVISNYVSRIPPQRVQ